MLNRMLKQTDEVSHTSYIISGSMMIGGYDGTDVEREGVGPSTIRKNYTEDLNSSMRKLKW